MRLKDVTLKVRSHDKGIDEQLDIYDLKTIVDGKYELILIGTCDRDFLTRALDLINRACPTCSHCGGILGDKWKGCVCTTDGMGAGSRNKHGLEVGDIVLVEQAWEDEAGNYHDEFAEVKAIGEDGRLELDFYQAKEKTKEFLKDAEFFANDFERNPELNKKGGEKK